jgi:hypothetical protein
VLLLLGYLTTKATCSRHVHAQSHTRAGASLYPRDWGRRSRTVVPNPQLPFNTELFTVFTSRGPLAHSSLHPTCRHLTWSIPPHSALIEIITSFTVVSDSKISATSDTLPLMRPSHIDISLVPPFACTTTASSCRAYGRTCML